MAARPEPRPEQDATRINNEPVENPKKLDFAPLVESQRRFFRSGATRSYNFRQKQLESLEELVSANESRIHDALALDLGKPQFEAFASETGFIRSEVRYALNHLEEWMEPEHVGDTVDVFPRDQLDSATSRWASLSSSLRGTIRFSSSWPLSSEP